MDNTLHQNHITQSGLVPEPNRPLGSNRRLLTLGIFLGVGAPRPWPRYTFTQPEPLAQRQSFAHPEPSTQRAVTATANVAIAGGGGSFNPFSLTVNAATRVTWTNTGNSRARVPRRRS